MKEYQDIEKQIAHRRKLNPRFAFTLSLVLALVGGGLIYAGKTTLGNREILAETSNPPVILSLTPSPSVTASTIIPPIPPDPNQPQLVFNPGWNMVEASKIQGTTFGTILNYGLLVYSFNDPSFPNRDWSVFSSQGLSQIGGTSVLKAVSPLGYYVYNLTSQTYRIPVQTGTTVSDKTIPRGWHILFFGGGASTKDELMNAISIKYSNGKTMTAKEASSDANHRISSKIFVVVDEKSVGANSVKELTNSDSANSISRIPANSYFWFYTRRTKDSISQISITAITSTISQSEKTKIDAWLTQNSLTECGDPKGTVYTGGSCLFDETTGQTKDKYALLVAKFPNRQWNNACITDKEFLKLKNSPSSCLCPSSSTFQIIRDSGQCPAGTDPKDCNIPQFVKCATK